MLTAKIGSLLVLHVGCLGLGEFYGSALLCLKCVEADLYLAVVVTIVGTEHRGNRIRDRHTQLPVTMSSFFLPPAYLHEKCFT